MNILGLLSWKSDFAYKDIFVVCDLSTIIPCSIFGKSQHYRYDAAMVDIDSLRMAGVEDSSIRSSVTRKIKPLYKEAWDKKDGEEVMRLQRFLISLDIGYNEGSFASWRE